MVRPQRKQRVKNTTHVIVNGIEFTSKAEGFYYSVLLEKQRNGEIKTIELQEPFELQPQYKKCQEHGCGFIWERPKNETSPDYKRYYKARECPHCGAELKLHREMTYICDFVITDADGKVHIIDVKSSQFFQTEVFKIKKKLFEYKYPAILLEEVYPRVPKDWMKERVI